ncbi:helix-turn-helix domain-containing protein [Aureimonas altamirensis]|uniref:helix-turn-helix domain-containing protein n=1 Tax=Aureimonas altamirensis TaxID=370622 RepID=UPI0025562BBE|nr:helix-turn-helix domain-containing protein [Aureimonas altamirensis]
MSFQATSWAVRQKVGSSMGKIILLMIANRADEDGRCFPSQQRLASDCECSVRTVREWLSRFEQKGILRRCERRRNDGRKTSDEIYLAMDGLFPVHEADEQLDSSEISSPAPAAGCDFDPAEHQAAAAADETSAAADADFTGSSCRLTYHRTYQDSVVSERATLHEFDRVFWDAYPHKVGKGQARSAWIAARRKADLKAIMDGLLRYVQAKPERIAWCNPATWLNGERWLDQPSETARNIGVGGSRSHHRKAKSFGDRVCDFIDQQARGDGPSCFDSGVVIDG